MENDSSSFLTKTKNIGRSAVIWNAIAACLTSFQTMLLLMLLTHFGTAEHSGYFVMAFTAANLFMNIGKFGMRKFQVSDRNLVYSFNEYRVSRIISCLAMMVASCAYIAYSTITLGYSAEKTLVMVVMCVFKAIDAFD